MFRRDHEPRDGTGSDDRRREALRRDELVTGRNIDPVFLALGGAALADTALTRAQALGAVHAEFRLQRMKRATITTRDGRPESAREGHDLGVSVRVIYDGTWGFASSTSRNVREIGELTERAVEMARLGRLLCDAPVVLAAKPTHVNAAWVSSYETDPFDVPQSERIGRLAELSTTLLTADGVDRVYATLDHITENTYYADTQGSSITQQRVRLHPEFTAVNVHRNGGFTTLRTIGPAVARGWEYLFGAGWDWDAELAALPELLREKVRAPGVEPGRYDLVIHPSNLWLTIHESIGHATELDRVLGHEAAFAGTSFATLDQLGALQYGSPAMSVVGDRTQQHGLATVGYDAEGVAAQEFDIIRDGILRGYQLYRQMAHENGFDCSNGCAYAASAADVPLQRMPNVSLQPDLHGPTTEDLIGQVERGIYVVGDGSWSIDMQRLNFQFTGQQFHRIVDGRLAGQLRDVAYQATTTEFWRSMAAIGGPDTYLLSGTIDCGKGQPTQPAPVSHGCPSVLFRDVNILNTAQGATR